jgi:MFS family permease
MRIFGIKLSSILHYLWLILLAATLLVSVQSAYRRSLNTEEFAYACDQFGYLRMAKEIRSAAREGELPEFKLESSQTRLLIDFMQAQRVPVPDWEEVVAPHAHHYFPKSNYVGVQYPPGTGLTLALFPEGRAVYGLNKTVVVFFLLVGIGALVFAAWKHSWASAGLVILAIHLGLSILGRMGSLSFSINAVLIPLLLSCLLTILALRLNAEKRRLAIATAFAAGVLLGFGTLIRLPVIFLAPGFLILLWSRNWRIGITSLPLVFALGAILIGIIPVLLHQQTIAGAWYLSTYASNDAALPTLERFGHNISYFFGDGPGAEDNWALRDALVGFSGFVILLSLGLRTGTNRLGLTWKRVGLAALVTWLLSTLFFLTHWIVGPHYAIPGIFVAVALIGFGSLAVEATSNESAGQFDRRNPALWIALALVLWPGFTTLNRAWSERTQNPAPDEPVNHAPIVLPAELADARAWIWADLLTGTLWYYANKPAYKIQFTNPETRAKIFKFVFDRGEPQYLIQDSERMQKYIDEIESLGGTVEMKGKIDGHNPYFLIHWSKDGPAVKAVAGNVK